MASSSNNLKACKRKIAWLGRLIADEISEGSAIYRFADPILLAFKNLK